MVSKVDQPEYNSKYLFFSRNCGKIRSDAFGKKKKKKKNNTQTKKKKSGKLVSPNISVVNTLSGLLAENKTKSDDIGQRACANSLPDQTLYNAVSDQSTLFGIPPEFLSIPVSQMGLFKFLDKYGKELRGTFRDNKIRFVIS